MGAPGVNDYLIYVNSFISKLESHRAEITDLQILRLMSAARSTYIALTATVCLGLVAMAVYAN